MQNTVTLIYGTSKKKCTYPMCHEYFIIYLLDYRIPRSYSEAKDGIHNIPFSYFPLNTSGMEIGLR